MANPLPPTPDREGLEADANALEEHGVLHFGPGMPNTYARYLRAATALREYATLLGVIENAERWLKRDGQYIEAGVNCCRALDNAHNWLAAPTLCALLTALPPQEKP